MGILAGIARHMRPKGPIETIDRAVVTPEGGVAGDYRGVLAVVVSGGEIAVGDTIEVDR